MSEPSQVPCHGQVHEEVGQEVMAKKPLTAAEKYRQLKAQTERAGMKVEEVDGKIIVRRKPVRKK